MQRCNSLKEIIDGKKIFMVQLENVVNGYIGKYVDSDCKNFYLYSK